MNESFGTDSEFEPLREVVVGTAEDLHLPPFGKDLSHYNDELRSALLANGNRPLDVARTFPERYERTVEQIEGVVRTYEAFGVKVHRPRPFTAEERGYLGTLQQGHSQLYPADPVYVIGKHYMEISIRRAYRRKEVFALRDLVLPMIEADPEARYVAMPQSLPWTPSGEGPGPFLEGGDILVNGADVMVGQGELCSNAAGLSWLKRYIECWGYRVHAVPIKGCDPARPGHHVPAAPRPPHGLHAGPCRRFAGTAQGLGGDRDNRRGNAASCHRRGFPR